MSSKNIEYKSKQILEFYSHNRRSWKDFYPSERWVFRKIAGSGKVLGDILDVGCACGGLASAVCEKFKVKSYTGVDIHKGTIRWARQKSRLSIPTEFISGDIIKQNLSKDYDIVVSLSCADWNRQTDKIIAACWDRVKPGGHLVISLRLTNKKGINDMRKSFQYINFFGKEKRPEVANYVVFNFREALGMMRQFFPSPELIGAYGYWGKLSSMAVTPFKKLVFAVFYIKKGMNTTPEKLKTEFNLPIDIFL